MHPRHRSSVRQAFGHDRELLLLALQRDGLLLERGSAAWRSDPEAERRNSGEDGRWSERNMKTFKKGLSQVLFFMVLLRSLDGFQKSRLFWICLSDFRFTQCPIHLSISFDASTTSLQVVLAAVRQNGNAFKPLWHSFWPFFLSTCKHAMFVCEFSGRPRASFEVKGGPCKMMQRSCEAKQSKHLTARSNFLLQELHSWSSQDQCWCGESCFLASRALISRSARFLEDASVQISSVFLTFLQKSWAVDCRFRLCGAPTGPSWTCFIVSLLEWRCLATVRPMETVLLHVATLYLCNVFPAGEWGGMQFDLWRKAWRSVAEELFA